jgi:exosortase/archaeosortase family protein
MTSTTAAPAIRRRSYTPIPTVVAPVRRGQRIGRLLLAMATIAAGIVVMANERTFRSIESEIGAHLFSLVMGDAVAATTGDDPSIAFELGGHWYALRVTIECSIALYLGPLMMLGGALLATPRMGVIRIALATLTSVTTMAALNQARFLMLGYALGSGDRARFDWMHSLVGSSMMLLGIALSLTLFFRVVVVGSRRTVRSAGRRSS